MEIGEDKVYFRVSLEPHLGQTTSTGLSNPVASRVSPHSEHLTTTCLEGVTGAFLFFSATLTPIPATTTAIIITAAMRINIKSNAVLGFSSADILPMYSLFCS